jgi:hypothetical protein
MAVRGSAYKFPIFGHLVQITLACHFIKKMAAKTSVSPALKRHMCLIKALMCVYKMEGADVMLDDRFLWKRLVGDHLWDGCFVGSIETSFARQ